MGTAERDPSWRGAEPFTSPFVVNGGAEPSHSQGKKKKWGWGSGLPWQGGIDCIWHRRQTHTQTRVPRMARAHIWDSLWARHYGAHPHSRGKKERGLREGKCLCVRAQRETGARNKLLPGWPLAWAPNVSSEQTELRESACFVAGPKPSLPPHVFLFCPLLRTNERPT